MENKKLFTIPGIIFFILLFIAIPFHIDSTNHIVERQYENENISGFIFDENQRNEARFRPREYIHTNRHHEENLNEGS
ncbi:hypothetical protein J2S74_001694 [Evansella vedderi]|uniref:Uncharacterized protein n=1 Tax=Evansella vedderi TaxID=38282 RepID=A0ABT9ZTX5_9BACI|nr:hypothetical protein [Evansella vedderi]MDQ0254319.1 hypothetical protein [Evansella vedderi]